MNEGPFRVGVNIKVSNGTPNYDGLEMKVIIVKELDNYPFVDG